MRDTREALLYHVIRTICSYFNFVGQRFKTRHPVILSHDFITARDYLIILILTLCWNNIILVLQFTF